MSDTAFIDEAVETIAPEELRDGARRLLSDKVDRRAGWVAGAGTADGSGLQRDMADLGWLLLTAPAARGGLGQSFAALAPIYEEMGRALSPVMIADTMAAVDVLGLTDDIAGGALLDRIVAGKARVAIIFADLADTATDARFATITGAAAVTDLLILPLTDAGKAMLFALDGETAKVVAVQTWDRTRDFGDVTLSGATGGRLGVDRAAAVVARAHLDLAMAWDCLGAARQSLDEAVAYMGIRQQFGRPIGSFQALKHRAADHKVAIEISHALARQATEAFAGRTAGWPELAGQARLLAVDAFRAMAEDSIQLHGGIGFTWEHDCHLFLKRALMNEVLGETPEQVRDRIAPGMLTRALAGH